GISRLVWKPFTDDAVPPKWISKVKEPSKIEGKVAVSCFISGWCPATNIVYERARRAAAEIGDKVVFQSIDTTDRSILFEWGIADGVYIDGKNVQKGPPPSYEKIHKLIAKKARRL
ncbi:MAG: hypothetical protein GY854_10015, partial [Deltaproteobacteria bacterium]|nr:hypothetical protein [Deltaproteobacteria bacterium]